jgi:hypothetical protein
MTSGWKKRNNVINNNGRRDDHDKELRRAQFHHWWKRWDGTHRWHQQASRFLLLGVLSLFLVSTLSTML